MRMADSDKTGEPAELKRRRWEAVLPREEIAQMLAEGRLRELLDRLAEARKKWPRDLELIRSIRVIEDHLKSHPDAPG